MTRATVQFDVGALQRRSPFGDNPDVGSGGIRTQQRIMRAALEVFDEVGYHGCGVDRITAKAKCSRPTFYQYFASKEDLFRHLSGTLSRRLFALCGDIGPVGPGPEGRAALHAFVVAYGDLFDLYSPVFAVFSTAVVADDAVAEGAARVFGRQVEALEGNIDAKAFRHRHRRAVVAVLLNALSRAQRFRQVVNGSPEVPLDRARIDDALADVVHRVLFGPLPGVNVREPVPASQAGLDDAFLVPGLVVGAETEGLGPAGRRTRARLLDAGRRVLAANGYHDTRVDDIVADAGTSHGTFYRYFENKDGLFRVLAARSGRRVIASIDDLSARFDPSVPVDPLELRAWLRAYFAVYAAEGPVIRAWVEAMWFDPGLRSGSTAEVEMLWRRLAAFLSPRDFGDTDADAVVLCALLDRSWSMLESFGADERTMIDVYAMALQRGVLPVD